MNPESLKQAREIAEKAKHNHENERCIECGFNHKIFRHHYDCSYPESAHKETMSPSFTLQLLDHVDALEKKLEKAGEALKEYADEDNWTEANEETCPAFLVPGDIVGREKSHRFTGGEIARLCLKELES